MGIYKSDLGKEKMMRLYDEQITELNIEWEDIFIDTSFGKTHIIKTGNPQGRPLLMFHGGNSTCPYSLKDFLELRDEYLIYAPDTIGHPGKSDETFISSRNSDYGKWASEIISGLQYQKMICIGGSYGGGIVAKLMSYSPEVVSKAVLIVPSGIANTSLLKILIKMGIPMILYRFSRKDKWLKKSIKPMALAEEFIDDRTLDMVKKSFDNICIKAQMPSNIKYKEIRSVQCPVLVLAGEKDVLFPGKKVASRMKKILPHAEIELINSGHMFSLIKENMDEVMYKIKDFLERNEE